MALKTKDKDSNIRLLHEGTELLPCELTNNELLERGNEMAHVEQDIAAEEKKQKSLKTELKARMDTLISQRSDLANRIANRQELRDIRVRIEIDYNAGKWMKTRLDTGQVIKSREITEDERQLNLES